MVQVTRLHNKEGLANTCRCSSTIKENNWKDIYKLNRLCHAVVRVEDRKRRPGPIQCARCQGYYHTKKLLQHVILYVPYVQEIIIPKIVKWRVIFIPKCANCNVEGHRANARSNVCSHFTKVLESKSANSGNTNKSSSPSNKKDFQPAIN